MKPDIFIQKLPDSYLSETAILSNGFRLISHKNEKYIYHILSNSILKKNSELASFLLSLDKIDNKVDFDIHAENIKVVLGLNTLKRPSLNNTKLPVSYLAISPTMNCNLRCTYCYNFQEGDEKNQINEGN